MYKTVKANKQHLSPFKNFISHYISNNNTFHKIYGCIRYVDTFFFDALEALEISKHFIMRIDAWVAQIILINFKTQPVCRK